jgi:hypothetical protein
MFDSSTVARNGENAKYLGYQLTIFGKLNLHYAQANNSVSLICIWTQNVIGTVYAQSRDGSGVCMHKMCTRAYVFRRASMSPRRVVFKVVGCE